MYQKLRHVFWQGRRVAEVRGDVALENALQLRSVLLVVLVEIALEQLQENLAAEPQGDPSEQ